MPRVVAAPDKFRGTASARQIAGAVADVAWEAGWDCDTAPVSDGGEGLLDVLGGAVRHTTVTGPLGDPVEAEWRMREGTAVLEMAQASGLLLAGGPEGNDPLEASTLGTGELIVAALEAGARRIVVGVGGSASTDGGLGALRAVQSKGRLAGIELVVAHDVSTPFVDAAATFGPQKGATPAQVALLERRLERLAQVYVEDYGVDVRAIEGSGAAGGLAGGLAAVGAELIPGFDLVADLIDLEGRMEGADLVVTGEGFVDEQSFEGKAVGGVLELAAVNDVPALVVAGEILAEVPAPARAVSLVERFGRERAMTDTVACVREVLTAFLVTSTT